MKYCIKYGIYLFTSIGLLILLSAALYANNTLSVEMAELQDETVTFIKVFIIVLVLIIVAAVFLSNINYRLNHFNEESVDEKDRDVYDSIRYARHLQKAIFPDEKEMKKYFRDYFIVFKSIEMVSGDFQWFSHIGDKIFVAVVDCYGHGVPGAFLTMIGNTLLNQIINEEKVYKPEKILYELNRKVSTALNNGKGRSGETDIMNICICSIDRKEKIITFAGAGSPLYYVKDGKFREIEGDDYPIGEWNPDKDIRYNEHIIEIDGDLTIYLTSEGFHYFKAPVKENIEALQMINLIISTGSLPFYKQEKAILNELEKYDYKKKQTDDFTILGIKVH